MTPTLPLPTDNIYKFACLFGLALIVVAVLGMVSTFNAAATRWIAYIEQVGALAAKSDRAGIEALTRTAEEISKITTFTGGMAGAALGVLLALGASISLLGALGWARKVQARDDKLAELQIRKLEAEIAKLRSN